MKTAVILLGLFSVSAFAETADVKLKGVKTNEDTSIVIKKGANNNCVQYDILEGREDISGSPEFDRSKAYASWKTACSEWKQSMREMNKENRVISLNCNAATATKEGEQSTYRSSGSYKIRVKMAEAQ